MLVSIYLKNCRSWIKCRWPTYFWEANLQKKAFEVYETCKQLEEAGYAMQKAPDAGSMKGLAFARDPDGYWVEIIKRGGYDEEATPYFF